MVNDPIVFEDWEAVLKAEVPPDRQRRYREAIVKFRYWLREKGKKPILDTFKEHLDWKRSYLTLERFEVRQEALRIGAVSSGAPGTQEKVSGEGARFAEATQTTAPEAQKREGGRQATVPTPAGCGDDGTAAAADQGR